METLFYYILLHLKYNSSKNTFYVIGNILHVRNEWCLHGGDEYNISPKEWTLNYHNKLTHDLTGCRYCVNDDLIDNDGCTYLFEWSKEKGHYLCNPFNPTKIKVK